MGSPEPSNAEHVQDGRKAPVGLYDTPTLVHLDDAPR